MCLLFFEVVYGTTSFSQFCFSDIICVCSKFLLEVCIMAPTDFLVGKRSMKYMHPTGAAINAYLSATTPYLLPHVAEKAIKLELLL